MNILGISGLDNSESFKRGAYPGLTEREYRMCQGYDSAAALVVEGKVVAAAAEERFTRKKHTGAFPIEAIRYCLSEAGLSLEDIDEIAHGFDYSPYRRAYSVDSFSSRSFEEVLSRGALLNRVAQKLHGYPVKRVHSVSHHLAHAASAYYTSGWDDCLVIVIDGMGEVHSASVYRGHQGQLDALHHMSAHDSIGILYSLVTFHLGFDFNADEYKIMGLAPYGDPDRFRPFFDEAVKFRHDGSWHIPLLRMNRSREERETYRATRRYLHEHLIPERAPESDLTDEHRDVAAALQACLDKAMLHLCGHFAAKTRTRRLALAGGVALNCTANGMLMRSGLFDEIYVQPVAGDDGAALGAALYRAAVSESVQNRRLPVPFLGPSYSRPHIEAALEEFRDRIDCTPFETLEETCAAAATLIAQGHVLAWYRGRMEFGPRALGHRSILADPGHPQMRDRINAMVKKREAFRPFAPVVSLEQAHEWFEVAPLTELPYMIFTVNVRNQYRSELPAVTHINGSARVQTVGPSDTPDFYALLRAVGKTTGREMLLNTSFNIKAQPIVNTPREALETFLGTGIDVLFLENVLVRRRGTTS